MVFEKSAKKAEEKAIEEKEIAKLPEKTENQCVEEGCYEPKAPGQSYVCAKHIRSN